jgi:hypothetical protein
MGAVRLADELQHMIERQIAEGGAASPAERVMARLGAHFTTEE